MKKPSRIGWVASCLRFAGKFGPWEKKALVAMLGVSEATISRDQTALLSMLPENGGVLLKGGKLELVEPADLSFPDDLVEPELDEWLKVMLSWRYVSTTGVERIAPSSNTIRMVLKAVQDRRALFIRYMSCSSPDATWCAVSPHSIVNVAGRYHARGFNHQIGDYDDFSLTRVLGGTFDRSDTPGYVDDSQDKDWHRRVDVKVTLREGEPNLVGSLDYGLGETASRIIRMRKALVPYIIDYRNNVFDDPVEVQYI